MFPIRRPCADVVRSGIPVIWSSSTALYSGNGFYPRRVFIKQFQCSSTTKSLFTSCITNNDNQLASPSNIVTHSQPSSMVNPSPPALNTVLRGSPNSSSSLLSSSSTAIRNQKSVLQQRLKSGLLADDDGLFGQIKFATAPKGKERDSESEPEQQQMKKSGGSSGGDPDKPGLDQLQKTYNILQKSLEKTFTHPMDYTIYNPDIIFIDNIRHIRTQGLAKYIQQVALLKTVGHFKFAYVRFEILNMSMSQEEARITVRWRINGLSGLRVMLKFWKYKLWKWQEIMKNQETWYDGISYFDVGPDGKIFRHIADKVMEDKDRSVDDKATDGRSIPFAAKLGGALGVTAFPTPSLSYDNGSHSSTSASDDETCHHVGGEESSASVVKSS